MKCSILESSNNWRAIANSANTTINKEDGDREPSVQWKRRMLLAEHSPIRKLRISARWTELKYWVSVHFVRHKIGIEHWVRTQRADRTGLDRNELPQGSHVEHEFEANAQAIVTISRKRLCSQASLETQEAWRAFLLELKECQPELYSACVPDCVYRGHCFEFKTCGFHKTPAFQEALAQYREGVNQ